MSSYGRVSQYKRRLIPKCWFFKLVSRLRIFHDCRQIEQTGTNTHTIGNDDYLIILDQTVYEPNDYSNFPEDYSREWLTLTWFDPMHLLDELERKKSHKYSRDHRQGTPNSMNLPFPVTAKFIYDLFLPVQPQDFLIMNCSKWLPTYFGIAVSSLHRNLSQFLHRQSWDGREVLVLFDAQRRSTVH